MRRISDLMKDLGFNKDAPIETQKAFIKHLIQAANVSQFQRKIKPLDQQPEQLSFDLEGTEMIESHFKELANSETNTPNKKQVG